MSEVKIFDGRNQYCGPRPTYRASGLLVAPASTAPFLVISGKAGKVIRVQSVRIGNASLTAAALLRLVITKFSALPTGGTSTPPAKVPMDSNDPTSDATLLVYTAANTPGTAVGPIAETVVSGIATGATTGADDKTTQFSDDGVTYGPKIQGAAECIGVGFGTAPASAVTLSYEIEWTEDGN